MQQMNPGDMGQRERSYGAYEGAPEYKQSPEPGATFQGPYDDDFMDSMAQRLSQRMGQNAGQKIGPDRRSEPSAGQRLALAIVSVGVLVPLSAIVLGTAASSSGILFFPAIIVLALLAVAIVTINFIFSRRP